MLFQRKSNILKGKSRTFAFGTWPKYETYNADVRMVHRLCTKSKSMDSRAKGQEYDKRRTATRESTALSGVLL